MRKPPRQEPKHDALGRRIGDTRQPTEKHIFINDVDLERLEFLHRHGALPTPYIHERTKQHSKNDRATNYRLRDLYHEIETGFGGPLLDRPPQQYRTKNPERNYCVHSISKYGIRALGKAGRTHENTPLSSGSWDHDFLRACYTASIELGCRSKPDLFRFIHHDTVINNAIKKTGKVPEFRIDGKNFVPDALFGIHYLKQNKVRLFAVEIDMMTESITSKSRRTKTVELIFDHYRKFIGNGLYKRQFAFGGSFFLVVITVNPTHAHNIMKRIPHEEFILFNWIDGFEYYIKPPNVMPWLFAETYDRCGHAPFDMSRF